MSLLYNKKGFWFKAHSRPPEIKAIFYILIINLKIILRGEKLTKQYILPDLVVPLQLEVF